MPIHALMTPHVCETSQYIYIRDASVVEQVAPRSTSLLVASDNHQDQRVGFVPDHSPLAILPPDPH